MSNIDPLLGKKLGDYTIQNLLGKGGMARVYQGYDETLDRYAAVKVIEPQLVSGEDDEEYRDRFVREARAIARLNHPRVVGIFQFGDVDKELYYMAMVFVEGNDLHRILKNHGEKDQRLSYAQVLKVVQDIAEALDYSHEQGVIHRDVKPSNIMVTKDGHAVLTDFGLALNTSEGTIGNTFGSVHYIAPEQAVSSAQAVAQSDLYSLGVVLYEMLVGRVPFEDMSAMSVALKHISDPPPQPSLLNPKITPQIEEVVLKCLDKDPRRRYQTGKSLVMALQSAFATSPDEDTEELDDATPLPSTAVPPVIERAKTDPERPSKLPTPTASPAPDTRDKSPTRSDSDRDKPIGIPAPGILGSDTQAQHSQSTQPRASSSTTRTGIYVLGGVILLAILSVGALLLSGAFSRGDDDAEANQTETAVALLALQPTQTEVIPTDTLEPVASETEEAVITATDTDEPSYTETPVPTATETELLVTNTPVPTNTPQPTATPTITSTPILSLDVDESAPQLVLIYDARTMILYNRALNNESIDISDLVFHGRDEDDNPVIFQADEWTNGSRLVNMRPALDCFQLWTIEFTTLPIRDECQFRQGGRSTSSTFWVNEADDATFDVTRFGRILATCRAIPEDFRSDEIYCEVELR